LWSWHWARFLPAQTNFVRHTVPIQKPVVNSKMSFLSPRLKPAGVLLNFVRFTQTL
jgi:hypothetical protein